MVADFRKYQSEQPRFMTFTCELGYQHQCVPQVDHTHANSSTHYNSYSRWYVSTNRRIKVVHAPAMDPPRRSLSLACLRPASRRQRIEMRLELDSVHFQPARLKR